MTTGCQYIGPEQDPARGPLKFCGCKDLWPGRNYCIDHVWKIYKKGSSVGVSRKNKLIEQELEELKRLQEIEEIEND